jgi:hypothetical protein
MSFTDQKLGVQSCQTACMTPPLLTLEYETTCVIPETSSPFPSAYSQSWTHSNSADASDQIHSSPEPRYSKPHSPSGKSVQRKRNWTQTPVYVSVARATIQCLRTHGQSHVRGGATRRPNLRNGTQGRRARQWAFHRGWSLYV